MQRFRHEELPIHVAGVGLGFLSDLTGLALGLQDSGLGAVQHNDRTARAANPTLTLKPLNQSQQHLFGQIIHAHVCRTPQSIHHDPGLAYYLTVIRGPILSSKAPRIR